MRQVSSEIFPFFRVERLDALSCWLRRLEESDERLILFCLFFFIDGSILGGLLRASLSMEINTSFGPRLRLLVLSLAFRRRRSTSTHLGHLVRRWIIQRRFQRLLPFSILSQVSPRLD